MGEYLESREVWQKGLTSICRGSDCIFQTVKSALQTGKGALIGRHGTIELETILQFEKLNSFRSCNLRTLERNAGIFPTTNDSILEWYDKYTDATRDADVIAAGWYAPLALEELELLERINPDAVKIPLRSLEPYYIDMAWTRVLAGQTIAVVSSFAESMKKQIDFKEDIWSSKWREILPDAEWHFIRSFYSPLMTAQGGCQWPNLIKSWSDAITYLEEQIMATGARIALLGCGGLAMPLAAALKRRGIIAIVLGGAIQILFGIKGRRWEKHPVISKFYTNDWIYPSLDEVPRGAKEVERGCYW